MNALNMAAAEDLDPVPTLKAMASKSSAAARNAGGLQICASSTKCRGPRQDGGRGSHRDGGGGPE